MAVRDSHEQGPAHRLVERALVERAALARGAEAKRYRHPKFGDGVLRAQDGAGPEAKLTIEFATGPRTLLARFVTELLP